MDWISLLRPYLSGDAGNFTQSQILIELFRKLTYPEISLNNRGKIVLPDRYSIKVGFDKSALLLVLSPSFFNATPHSFQKSLLDLLYLLLRRDVYDVIRFQLVEPDSSSTNGEMNLLHMLLQLLNQRNDTSTSDIKHLGVQYQPISVSKRIIHLIGIIGAAGISARNLKNHLSLLRSPSDLSVSLLQALKLMMHQNSGVTKASPSTFFNFGGRNAGLTTEPSAFPFPREYQFCTWFRVENFEDGRSTDPDTNRAFSFSGATQHIFTWSNTTQRGMDIFLDGKVLALAIVNHSVGSKLTEPLVVRLGDYPLRRGVWYHLCVKHSKPRMALFGSDELTIHLDQQMVFQDTVRFPALGTATDVEFSLGRNFDGQMTPVYLFSEALPSVAIETIARLDAGKSVEGIDNGFNPVIVDLLPSITASDRKVTPILGKVTLSYHPSRVQGGQALDIHGGRHARVGAATHSWSIVTARDLLNCMGGLSCLLPLFPKLLIESEAGEQTPSSSASTGGGGAGASFKTLDSPSLMRKTAFTFEESGTGGLGTSLAIYGDENSTSEDVISALDYSLLSLIRSEKEELNGDGCIALLLAIIARCITSHKTYQVELLNVGGVEMIEYALSCVPQEILQVEGERCVLALIQLKAAAADCPSLELRITRALLCNVGIWSRASFTLLSSLMSVILAAIRAQPDLFLNLLGVKSVLDSLEFFVPNELESNPLLRPFTEEVPVSNEPIKSVLSPVLEEFADTPSSIGSDTTPRKKAVNFSTESALDSSFSVKRLRRTSGDTNINTLGSPALHSNTTTPKRDHNNRMKRMKSFKMSLTETIEDTVMTEENSTSIPLDKIKEEDEASPHHDEEVTSSPENSNVSNHGGVLMEAAASANNSYSKGSGVSAASHHDLTHTSQVSMAASEQSHGSSSHHHHIKPALSVDIEDAVIVSEPATLESEEPPLISPQTNEQRKLLRDCLEAMIVMLVQQGGNEKEVAPLLEFMVVCKDKVVLNEMAQIILYFLVEGGPKIMTAIISACNGPEEFASFVLLFLVHQPNEELRCSGIRILTHFYLRVDVLPPHVMNISLKKKGFLARAVSNISGIGSGLGLQRLQLCGGIALLCEIISSHTQSSTDVTYSALLELLLTRPGAKTQVTVQYSDLFEQMSSVPGTSTSSKPSAASTTTSPQDLHKRSRSTSSVVGGKVGQRSVVFAAHYISPDQVHDEGVDMTNRIALPVFFELLPKLPTAVQEQIYSDLLALLKHSAGNRDSFISCPSWHLCMFGLVSQLVELDVHQQYEGRIINSYGIPSELEKHTGCSSAESPFIVSERAKMKKMNSKQGELLRSWHTAAAGRFEMLSYSTVSINLSPAGKQNGGHHMSSKLLSPSSLLNNTPSNRDLWFALGMKVYATLLSHAMDSKGGWREVDRCVSQAEVSPLGDSISQTVLSHLLNETTFKMKSKYKELQRLAKSNNLSENQEAKIKLENILSLLLSASQLALFDQHCATDGIQNLYVCKLRMQYLDDLYKELMVKKQALIEGTTQTEVDPVTQSELRRLFEQTELRLRSKLKLAAEPSPVGSVDNLSVDTSDKTTATGEGAGTASSNNKEEYDQYLDFFHVWSDLSAAEEPNVSGRKDSNKVHHLSTGSSGNSPMKTIEELLHPLERNHDTSFGKLILVLQALRFFDALFWPSDSTKLRNTELLRFIKDSNPADLSSNKKRELSQSALNVFSATMRMSLFVLNRLSPLTYLSVINAKRIQLLVNSVDKVAQNNLFTLDWLYAAVLHVTLNLQRISHALNPIFDMIGILNKIQIQTLGPWDDSYDDSPKLNEHEASVFDSVTLDAEKMTKLQQYFDSSAGRNIIRNIRTSFTVLVDAFEVHNSKLMQTMEERSYQALYVLVEQIKADILMSQAGNEAATHSGPDVTRNLFKSQSRSRMDSNAPENTGDIYDHPPAAHNSSFMTSGSGSPLPFGTRKRANSDDSTVSERSGTSSAEINTNASKVSNTSATEDVVESFFGVDIVLVLKWLRSPYLRFNPFRSISLIKAIDDLDHTEAKNLRKFSTELTTMREGLEEQRDMAVKSVEEMTELKELSLAVCDMLVERSNGRETQHRNAENLKLKNVAARWHDCIQSFEGEWSPWRAESTHAAKQPGLAYYELSKQSDNRLRKMLLSKLSEPLGHADAAYLEGKVKDQMNYEAGVTSESTVNLKDPSLAKATLPFKLAPNLGAKTNKSDKNNWDDEEEDAAAAAAIESESGSKGMGLGLFFQGGDKRPLWTQSFQWASDERSLLLLEAAQINLDQVVGGTVLLTNKCLYFHSRKRLGGLAVGSKPIVDQRWYLDRLLEAYGRRYLLQNCAIELFFTDAPELFLAFNTLSELQKFFRILRRQSTPLLTTPRSLNPRYAFANSPWTELWKKRQISNFEYLMRLNVIAGRSYNDITQYPVFPWIIADYESQSLDFSDPQTFRPLSKPIGALNPTRLAEFLERYKTFDDDVVPKFMYGSHYSSAGVVIHYMIRQEPFSTLAVNLQGGRFDCPDRIFFDISRTWQGCNQAMSDVKELIPELFCCPEAMMNSNHLPLGELQEGGKVDDVILPPWAKDAYDFVRINREALESDFVSAHLHEWIDLIFGSKQVGPAALAANNVFYYLTYENAINIEAIEDPLQREAAKAQVTHFGQTPSQLTTKDHPRRLNKDECVLPLFCDVNTIKSITVHTPTKQMGSTFGSVIAMRCIGERLMVVHANMSVCYYRWTAFPDGEGNPFTVKAEKNKVLPSANLCASDEILKGRGRMNKSGEDDKQRTNSTGAASTATLAGGVASLDSPTGKTERRPSVSFSPEVETSKPAEAETTSPLNVFGALRRSFRGLTLYNTPPVNNPVVIQRREHSNSSANPLERVRSSTLRSTASSDGEGVTRVSEVSLPDTTASTNSSISAMSHLHVALSVSELGQSRIVSCGYWDDALKVHAADSLKEIVSTSNGHLGSISCVQLGYQGGHTIVTGSVDGTCRVWILEKPSLSAALTAESYYGENALNDVEAPAADSPNANNTIICVHTLYGHQFPVKAISYNSDLDLVLSGSSSGLLCLHSVRKGTYVRSITHMEGTSADLVLATSPGYLVAHSWSDLQLHLFWINGQHLLSTKLLEGGNILVCGSTTGVVTFREMWSLKELFSLNLETHGSVKSLWFNDDYQFLFIGSEDGTFSVATDVETRWKSINSALMKSPLLG